MRSREHGRIQRVQKRLQRSKENDFIYADNNLTHAEYRQVKIDEFDYTWTEIEADGGIAEINKQFKEEYGENCFD